MSDDKGNSAIAAGIDHAVDAVRQRNLLRWYATTQRQLPWRPSGGGAHPNPYAVLVSEIMLQQTRVDTVIAAFERWMLRFPTFAALAAAAEDDVVAAWAGLGYYRRARGLHAAARAVVSGHGGVLPSDISALAALPGVGPYTLGALRSIAFDQPAALVDGNVARVFARWFAIGQDVTVGAGRATVWALAHVEAGVDTVAGATVDDSEAPPSIASPAAWSQALMELGALICTPQRPACGRCPVANSCQANALGTAATLPVKRARKAPLDVEAVALLWWRQGEAGEEVWLWQRPPTGRWAGLWQPPMWEGDDAETALQAFARGIGPLERGPVLEHALTHRRYRVTVFSVACEVVSAAGQRGKSATPWTTRAADAGAAASAWRTVSAIATAADGVSRLGTRLIEAAKAGGA